MSNTKPKEKWANPYEPLAPIDRPSRHYDNHVKPVDNNVLVIKSYSTVILPY